VCGQSLLLAIFTSIICCENVQRRAPLSRAGIEVAALSKRYSVRADGTNLD
jgi:hypothetical protein